LLNLGGVNAGMSPLPCCVIPHGMRVPVAVRLIVANRKSSYFAVNFTYYLSGHESTMCNVYWTSLLSADSICCTFSILWSFHFVPILVLCWNVECNDIIVCFQLFDVNIDCISQSTQDTSTFRSTLLNHQALLFLFQVIGHLHVKLNLNEKHIV